MSVASKINPFLTLAYMQTENEQEEILLTRSLSKELGLDEEQKKSE